MDEFTKTRLRVFLVFVLFVIFVFCVIFGSVKIYRQLSAADKADTKKTVVNVKKKAVPPKREPQRHNNIPEVKKKVVKKEIKFDDTGAFRGILPACKKFKRPKCGILADVTNNKILWSYNADKVVPVASMSKMLTVYIALNAMHRSGNRINLNSRVKLVKNSAMGREGSFGFKAGDVYTVEELMKSAIIRSSNDAASAIGAYIGDGEKRFVYMMNTECKKLGMKNSVFINPHGLPEKNKDNLSTMNDMLLLSLRILNEPDYMRFAKMQAVKIGDRTIVSTNNLMRKRKYPGVDGLKTGYTGRAGFCLAFSCLRDGRRLVGVVAGFPSSVDRENFVTALLDWAYK